MTDTRHPGEGGTLPASISGRSGCLAALIVTLLCPRCELAIFRRFTSYRGLSECRAALSLDLKDKSGRDLSPMTRQRRFTEDSAAYVTGRYDSSAAKAAVRRATEESLNGM